jgi:epoxide hydrolase-like predicted phosphatase
VDHGLDTRWEARLGLQVGELEHRMKPFWQAVSVGACTEEEVHQGMRERLGMSQEQVEKSMREMWDWYGGRLNVPLADYFRRLRRRYQTAILSNNFVGARREEQQRHQVEDLCDLIIYSHEKGFAKADRRIFELTWQRLGVQPEEMLFLDSAQVNVETARACGIQAVLFKDIAQALVALESRLQTSPRQCCANEQGSAYSRRLKPEIG